MMSTSVLSWCGDRIMLQEPVATPTPSLLYSNLCPLGAGAAYAHLNQVVVLPPHLPSNSTTASHSTSQLCTGMEGIVHFLTSCSLGAQQVLVVGKGEGLQVWEREGSRLLMEWKLPKRRSDAACASCAYSVRCAAFWSAPSHEVVLCAGDSSGAVHTFQVAQQGSNTCPSFELRPRHQAPVTAMTSAFHSRRGRAAAAADSTELVTADELGQVALWAAKVNSAMFNCTRWIDGEGVPCTLAVRCGTLICGRIDGTVRLHCMADGQMRTELVAHSRFLSGMDLHPTADIIATCSEDGTIGLWTLPADGNKVACLLSVCCAHDMLTGVAFCGVDGRDVAAVAYDSGNLRVWRGAAAAADPCGCPD